MASIGVTRMSSKGQIVIPASMRKNLKVGDDILIVQDDERIILKKSDKLSEQIKEDLDFARRTEEARRQIEAGNYIELDSENLDEMMKW
jgi:AbrB family looped-hinge helix DNA binding protein